MRIFKEFTTVRFCTHFHTFGELLDPSNVLDVNHFFIRFDKVLHVQYDVMNVYILLYMAAAM